MATGNLSLRTGASGLGAILVGICAASALAADAVLFPTPLHLIREIRDPIADSVATVEEYYQGNRVVSIRGPLTSIADYESAELTEIDRERGVYSISRFDEVARALTVTAPAGAQRSALGAQWEPGELQIRSAGARRQAGRLADLVEIEPPDDPSVRATIALDREIVLSRDGFDVLTGAAYPNRANREHLMIAAAARLSSRITTASPSRQRSEEFRLPLELTISYQLDGDALQRRNTVVAVDRRLPPPDLLVIPRGAQKVEGAWVQRARMLEQLDRP